jgi:hypothetical protein
VRVFEKPVQQVPLSIFDALQAGDILFTHVMRTGSDVCFELFEIFLRLSPRRFLLTFMTCFRLLNTQDRGWSRKTALGMSCML